MNQDNYLKFFMSPKLEVRELPDKGGGGVFAIEPIECGETLARWGGRPITLTELRQLPPETQSRQTVQVDEDCFLLTVGPPEPPDYINHSCMPNAGLSDGRTLVALRPIAVGEEVCFDYAMSDGCAYDEFPCTCGTPLCRGRVTGDDWRRPDLWARYQGYFSPYLQRRIERLRAIG